MWETERLMCGWYYFCFSEFETVCWGWTGHQENWCAHSCMCVCLLQLQHHCCRHCSHLTVTPLWPDNLPRSPHELPCSSRLALPIISPPPTHSPSLAFCLPLNSISACIHLSLSTILLFYITHLIFLFACFHLSPPHLLCGSSLSFVMLSAPTVLPVSVSMETPHGQEWLRGLWDTDTDPIRSHAHFVSQRATCLQP